jgi:hypothetical protein
LHLAKIFKKEGYFKSFVVLILKFRKIEKPILLTAGDNSTR